MNDANDLSPQLETLLVAAKIVRGERHAANRQLLRGCMIIVTASSQNVMRLLTGVQCGIDCGQAVVAQQMQQGRLSRVVEPEKHKLPRLVGKT